jgi:hypothetical protein
MCTGTHIRMLANKSLIMKNTLLSIIAFLFIAHNSYSQKLKFKEKTIVLIASSANEKYPVRFTDSKKTVKTNVTFDSNGDTLSYQIEKKTNWTKGTILDSLKATKHGITDFSLFAEITPKEGLLMVDFYPFIEENLNPANNFFAKNEFSIELKPRENLGFKFCRFHAGILTLPLKIYLDSRADENNNNVETAINVGLYAGALFGTKRYLKIPSEKEYRVYEYGWSINAFAGLNKLEINENNSLDVSSFEGTLVTSSLGANLGWHYKTFTIFGAVGFDIPLGDDGKDWSFKSKPWFGFGAGFDIF